jgi:hypothetical protein
MRINPKYWQERQKELRDYDFKMGRQLRDLLPAPESKPEVFYQDKEILPATFIERVNQLQAELNFTRNKLNGHMDAKKTQKSIKTSGKL